MSAPVIRGWCPGALRPMQSGDGLVVRIRPRGGRLTQDQAAGIAQLSREHGNGLIDLSSRANVQLRGVSEDTYPALIDGLRQLDLIDETTEQEARRNIIVSPFWQDGDETRTIAAALTQALAAPDAPTLPGKFGFAVDCGVQPVLASASADIRIERGANGQLICRAEGRTTGAIVTKDTAASVALTLAHWFVATGGAPDGRGRMARHLAPVPDQFTAVTAQPPIERPSPGPTTRGTLIAFEFGQLTAATLEEIAKRGPLRVTPWRMVLVEGAQEMSGIAGTITSPDAQLLNVVACTGAPACPQALGETRLLARALAAHIPSGTQLHVSGCTKGCARPAATEYTLVARPGDRFDLIHKGRASDGPVKTGLTTDMLTTHPETLFKSP
ncbi:precorrin-3B synthase [Actibacterium lipolyticum]|uniref:Ferredoxin-nitrite reductase n=1 Tax=Actibacterium lipolyticum TaxID=1524263 RepID=A0A238JYS8_9RHOB|nr:precorrin-3B synthase [Actibacterium lipolyticum]SMX34856.1 ferredoxin-nitrite reductase [Actibacterium lipolyticum]